MPNNKPLRKFKALEAIVARLLVGFTGWKAWLLGFFLNFAFRFAAREGIFLIDIGSTYVRTNMDEKEWKKVAGEAWEAVESGNLTEAEGKNIDDKFIKAFDNFTVFKRIKS
jgi:hypothetical protein